MSHFDSFAVYDRIRDTRMIPVFYHPDPDTACRVVKSCYEGGARAFEFTNRGDFADEVFSVLRRFTIKECPDLALGVGSVVDAPTASAYIMHGADFIVGPMFNPEVASLCNRHCIPYSPGCSTVTEVSDAQAAGCAICKVFPGDVLGPGFVKNIIAPMPWSRLMVTGGVDPSEENLSSWFKAGVFCVGMGSKLFPRDRIISSDWAYITESCRKALAIISRYATSSK